MTISDADRRNLYTGLEEILGPVRAEVLMEHLPPVGWADVATKEDLDGLEKRLNSKLHLVREAASADIAALSGKLDTKIATLSGKLDTEIATVSGKIDVESANRAADISRLEKSMEALRVSVLREQRIHLVVMITVLSGLATMFNLFG